MRNRLGSIGPDVALFQAALASRGSSDLTIWLRCVPVLCLTSINVLVWKAVTPVTLFLCYESLKERLTFHASLTSETTRMLLLQSWIFGGETFDPGFTTTRTQLSDCKIDHTGIFLVYP